MIEMRYKLEPPMPNKGREDRWTLQYRNKLIKLDDPVYWEWSDWIDVPYVSEE